MSQTVANEPLITTIENLSSRFPLSPSIEAALTIQGKSDFAEWFMRGRDQVENEYYNEVDRGTAPRARARKFLASLIDPMIGRPVRDVEQTYETIGRLLRWAWLSISIGVYDESIQHITDC